jgi:succinoglycan biosynthesis protein ExoA
MSDTLLEQLPSRPVVAEGMPFVTVLVPVRNEAAFIRNTLEQLLDQDYDPARFEILVADGGSTDGTAEVVRALARQYPQVRLLDNPGCWSSAGRNAALRRCRGDLILLVDGHCQLNHRRHLAEVVSAFARSGADCLGRPQPLDVTGATTVQRAIAAARSCWLGHHPASHIYSTQEGFVRPQSVAVAYRRQVFERVGLFDERFDACEDVEFNHRVARAGLRCFFTPRIAVRYHPRATLAGLFRQMVRYGRGRVRLLRKHPGSFSVPGFLPAAFVAGLIAGPLLAWLWPALGLAYAGGLALYACTLLFVSFVLAGRERRLSWLVLLPLVFFTIHCGAGTGIWWELLCGGPAPRPRAGYWTHD